VIELLSLLVAALAGALRSRRRLLLENLLLRQQLQVALRSQHQPRLRARDKLFWLGVRRLHRNWRCHLHLVRPETVLHWHRQGWRLFWHWRSGSALGRPRLNPEVRALIVTIAGENPHWGTERIRGELLKLGIAVSARSIRRYRRRGPARPPSQSWRTFLANHAQAIWAADLFVVQTLSFKTLYVLFLISHDRRRLVHFNVTAHPTAAWVWHQMIEATPWDQHPRYLIHDRDRVYGADFATRLTGLGIESIRTPVQAPRANAIGERVVRTLRRECLDHILPLTEQHVQAVLTEFVTYYNRDRPHRSLGLETPAPSRRPIAGEVVARPVLGGLHHVYERAA
jgi:transposase InsO family protein